MLAKMLLVHKYCMSKAQMADANFLSAYSDAEYFSGAWLSRIKQDVGDNFRLKVRIVYL